MRWAAISSRASDQAQARAPNESICARSWRPVGTRAKLSSLPKRRARCWQICRANWPPAICIFMPPPARRPGNWAPASTFRRRQLVCRSHDTRPTTNRLLSTPAIAIAAHPAGSTPRSGGQLARPPPPPWSWWEELAGPSGMMSTQPRSPARPNTAHGRPVAVWPITAQARGRACAMINFNQTVPGAGACAPVARLLSL